MHGGVNLLKVKEELEETVDDILVQKLRGGLRLCDCAGDHWPSVSRVGTNVFHPHAAAIRLTPPRNGSAGSSEQK